MEPVARYNSRSGLPPTGDDDIELGKEGRQRSQRAAAPDILKSTDDKEVVAGTGDDGGYSQSDDLPPIPAGLTLTKVSDSSSLLLAFASDPAHPDDPLTWSYTSRYFMTLLAALLTALASSAPSGASDSLRAEFGGNTALVLSIYLLGYCVGPFIFAPLSENYGRRPIFIAGTIGYTAFCGGCIGARSWSTLLIFRFFSGAFGAVPNTNSGALCGDIFNARDRGFAMSFYSVATFAGPALGPIVGAFTSDALGWNYVFVVLTALGGALCISVAFLPETYPAVKLTKLAEQLREATGDDRIVSRIELARNATLGIPRMARLKADTSRLLGTPFIMLFTEPVVACVTAFMAMVYGLIYITFEVWPIIFAHVHKLGPGYSSLPFLSILVGAIVSVPLTLSFQKKFLTDIKKNGGVATPEMRLPMASIGGILVVISFLWLGWSGYKSSTPWFVTTFLKPSA